MKGRRKMRRMLPAKKSKKRKFRTAVKQMKKRNQCGPILPKWLCTHLVKKINQMKNRPPKTKNKRKREKIRKKKSEGKFLIY